MLDENNIRHESDTINAAQGTMDGLRGALAHELNYQDPTGINSIYGFKFNVDPTLPPNILEVRNADGRVLERLELVGDMVQE